MKKDTINSYTIGAGEYKSGQYGMLPLPKGVQGISNNLFMALYTGAVPLTKEVQSILKQRTILLWE